MIVEAGKRITARHIRKFGKDDLKELEVPLEYLEGKIAAQDYVNKETGEVIIHANQELTLENISQLSQANIKKFDTLFINEL